MLYNPPQKWTEKLLDELPFGEDDRYERKSGEEISSNKLDEFFNKLSKEIGAFANSFGGTLFIGIADDNTKIGIPATATKGKTPTERWLENKIPTLFELRLQHFRISRVELSKKTQTEIGGDRIIIAIDVFDSELAPHQCVFDHKYYYRSNSESRPAPHHYLAFLWGRANSNMSQVATWWIKDFLNPLVDLLEAVQKEFNENKFRLFTHNANSNYRVNFFKRDQWTALISDSVGEYFLSTFPLIEKDLNSFERLGDSFDESLSKLESSIEQSHLVLKQLVDTYERMVKHEHIPRSRFENSNLQEIAQQILGQLRLQISNHPIESKVNLVRFIGYALLDLNIEVQISIPGIHESETIYSFSKEISKELKGRDESMSKPLEETKQLFEMVKSESLGLWKQLRGERINLAKRYAATFK